MLRKDAKGRYSAEIKHRTFGRRHQSLKTKVQRVAIARHAAYQALLDAGEPVRDLVEQLRNRKLTIEAVAECYAQGLPWEKLRSDRAWPGFGAAVDEYVAAVAARPDGSDATATSIRMALAHAQRFFGVERDEETDEITTDIPVESITTERVIEYRTYLLSSEDGAPALHSNTVALYLNKLAGLFTFLRKREERRATEQRRPPRLLHNPVLREEVPEHLQTRVRYLTEAEAVRVLLATPQRFQAPVALGLFGGLRIGEMRFLRPNDVDLERGLIYLHRRQDWTPKHGIEREVPISDALRPLLEAHLKTFASAEWVLPSTRDAARQPDQRDLERKMARIITDAGLIAGRDHPLGVTYHTFRHSFASWLVMEGVDLLTVAKLMGHTTIKQVQETYGHLSPHHVRAAIGRLDARWSTRSQVVTDETSSPDLSAPRTQAETQDRPDSEE